VVHLAEALEHVARNGPPEVAVLQARRVLQTVEEIFPRETDPVVDFEAYAIRRLAMALDRALAEDDASRRSSSRNPRGERLLGPSPRD
jgi:hypothetical protein